MGDGALTNTYSGVCGRPSNDTPATRRAFGNVTVRLSRLLPATCQPRLLSTVTYPTFMNAISVAPLSV